MTNEEREEALQGIVGHYGLPVLLSEIDGIIDRIYRGVLSVPLDKDPEKASLQLYAERMKAEGAMAVRMALASKVEAVKNRMREGKKK